MSSKEQPAQPDSQLKVWCSEREGYWRDCESLYLYGLG